MRIKFCIFDAHIHILCMNSLQFLFSFSTFLAICFFFLNKINFRLKKGFQMITFSYPNYTRGRGGVFAKNRQDNTRQISKPTILLNYTFIGITYLHILVHLLWLTKFLIFIIEKIIRTTFLIRNILLLICILYVLLHILKSHIYRFNRFLVKKYFV